MSPPHPEPRGCWSPFQPYFSGVIKASAPGRCPASRCTKDQGLGPPPAAPRVSACLCFGLCSPRHPQRGDSPLSADPTASTALELAAIPCGDPREAPSAQPSPGPRSDFCLRMTKPDWNRAGKRGGRRVTIFFFQFDLIKASFKEIDSSSQLMQVSWHCRWQSGKTPVREFNDSSRLFNGFLTGEGCAGWPVAPLPARAPPRTAQHFKGCSPAPPR